MITVIASAKLKEGKLDEVLAIAEKLVPEVCKEDGCILYELVQSTKDPLNVIFHEQWESKEALGAHAKSPHMAKYMPLFKACTDGEVTITPCVVLR